MGFEEVQEHLLATCDNGRCPAVVHRLGCEQAYAGVIVGVVVPAEEISTNVASVLGRTALCVYR